MICKSWPYCQDEAAAGRGFCKFHQVILDRVKASIKTGSRKQATVVMRSVTVKHVELVKPRPKRTKPKPN
jgi:hypothetical protein